MIGGFVAVHDRVEHIRRLNARGNKLVLKAAAEGGDGAMEVMEHAIRLFKLAVELNPDCALCNANLGDAYLRIDRNAEAERALKRQIELVPGDDDAYHALGMALRSLPEREEEAADAYR